MYVAQHAKYIIGHFSLQEPFNPTDNAVCSWLLYQNSLSGNPPVIAQLPAQLLGKMELSLRKICVCDCDLCYILVMCDSEHALVSHPPASSTSNPCWKLPQLSTKLQLNESSGETLKRQTKQALSTPEFLISRAWNQWVFSVLPGFLAVPFSSPGSGPHHHPHGAVPLLLLRSLGFAVSLWASWPDHDKCFPSQLRGKGNVVLEMIY